MTFRIFVSDPTLGSKNETNPDGFFENRLIFPKIFFVGVFVGEKLFLADPLVIQIFSYFFECLSRSSVSVFV